MISNLAPHPSPAGLLDKDGRAIEHLPGVIARSIWLLDEALSNYELHWHIVCDYCQKAGHPQPFARPQRHEGRLELVCPHARRISDGTQ